MPIDSAPDEPERARETPAGPGGNPVPTTRGHDTPARETPEPAGPGGDRVPEADAPETRVPEARAPDGQGGRVARDGQTAGAFRRDQLAEHGRYQARVDAAYAAYEARQAWAEAVPQLRAEWAEHKQHYPERSRSSPRTQPDGAWTAEAGRGLTPEQNAEATKACADLRDEADQAILPAIRRVEAASPDGRLAGLDHMLKGEDRLKEKIADDLLAKPSKTVREAIHEVPDPVRFTLCYPAERYAEGVATDVDRLKAEGFELIKLKNLWHTDQYKGINSQWRMPDTGTRLEMQFHTPESLEAKELTHGAYERIRAIGTSPAEQRELKAFQRRANALLASPPGVATIKDFPEKNHG